MRLNFQKIVTLLILSVFLVVSTAGNVFACTVCVDVEKSQGVNNSVYPVYKECCTENLINNHDDSPDVLAIHQLDDEQHGLCPDCSTHKVSAVFSKRAKRISTAATITAISNYFPLIAAKGVKLVVGNLAPQPLTRTSQTLLAHRTVVLLN